LMKEATEKILEHNSVTAMLRSFSLDEEMKEESEAMADLNAQCSTLTAIFKLLGKLQEEESNFSVKEV